MSIDRGCHHRISELFEKGLLWFAAPPHSASGANPKPVSALASQTRETLSFSAHSLPRSQAPISPVVSFGLEAMDHELPGTGLRYAAIHEFFTSTESKVASKTTPEFLPCSIPAILAARAWLQGGRIGYLVWIGKRCWPAPFLLAQIERTYFAAEDAANPEDTQPAASLLAHSLFTDPPQRKLALWAIETALRSPGVCTVIAACDTLRFALSQRLALAAEEGHTFGLLLRPKKDLRTPSAAHTRWLLSHSPSAQSRFPRWNLELVRCKGRQPRVSSWVVEVQDEETISLHIPALVASRTAPALQTAALNERVRAV